MRLFCKSLIFLAAIATQLSPARAQEQLAGFVFANAIGISDKADITANGKKLTKSGIEPGMATSGLGLKIGSYQVQVTAPACESASTQLQIAEGSTPVLISYLEPVIDPATKKPKNVIRLIQLPSQPQEQKYLLIALSVDPNGAFNATGSGRLQSLQFQKPVSFEAKKIAISDQTGSSAEAEVDKKDSYYCIIFHKADGKTGTVLVPQRIYHW
jgi:hypothetical protein